MTLWYDETLVCVECARLCILFVEGGASGSGKLQVVRGVSLLLFFCFGGVFKEMGRMEPLLVPLTTMGGSLSKKWM
jgi:hypothetical protein